jgi:endonuclease/exonuclease/phosphatase (EEP) superfamily protein YafD
MNLRGTVGPNSQDVTSDRSRRCVEGGFRPFSESRFWRLLTAAGTLACAATLLGSLGRFSWFLDLFSHFRGQYTVGLAALGAMSLLVRRRSAAVIFLAFAGANLAFVLPLYLGRPNPPPSDGPVLRAMLINVNTRLGDPHRVRQAIVAADPDLLVLQEISSRWARDLAWLTNSHPHHLSELREDNFGIGLFSKWPIVASEVVHLGGAGVPSILATVNVGPTNLRVLATHPVPPAGSLYSRWRNEQLDLLPAHARSPLPVLLLGDLNITPWNFRFRRLLQQSGLRDSARGFGVQPTWPSFNPLLRIPLDHCLHSPDTFILHRQVGPDVSSDHFPLIVTFRMAKRATNDGSPTISP